MKRSKHRVGWGLLKALVPIACIGLGAASTTGGKEAKDLKETLQAPAAVKDEHCCQQRGELSSPPARKQARTKAIAFTSRQEKLLRLSEELQDKLPRKFDGDLTQWLPPKELFELDELEVVTTILSAPGLQPKQVAVSPDGDFLGIAFDTGEVLTWSTTTGEVVLETGDWGEHGVEHPTDLWFSPDSSELFVTSRGISATASWNIAERQLAFRYPRGEASGIVLATETQPKRLVVTDRKRKHIELWDMDVSSLEPRTVIAAPGISSYAGDVAVADETRLIAVWPDDNDGTSASVFDLDSGAFVNEFDHNALIGNVRFSPDGSLLVTVGYDDTVALWDAETGVRIASRKLGGPFTNYAWFPMPMVFTEDGRHLLVSVKSPDIRILDTASLRLVGKVRGIGNRINEMYLLPGGDTLLVRGGNEVVLRRLYTK